MLCDDTVIKRYLNFVSAIVARCPFILTSNLRATIQTYRNTWRVQSPYNNANSSKIVASLYNIYCLPHFNINLKSCYFGSNCIYVCALTPTGHSVTRWEQFPFVTDFKDLKEQQPKNSEGQSKLKNQQLCFNLKKSYQRERVSIHFFLEIVSYIFLTKLSISWEPCHKETSPPPMYWWGTGKMSSFPHTIFS